MEFAENGRISHRQLYRQMILTLLAPFLICLFGREKIWGPGGLLGTISALILLLFYVIFLVRLAPYYGDTVKAEGRFMGRITGVFFLVYVILTASYLLFLIGDIVPKALLFGADKRWMILVAVLICSLGTSKGMQKRGRMAEVSGGFLLCGILLMMLVSISQGRIQYLKEFIQMRGTTGKDFIQSGYMVLCAFSVLGLLPFLLEDVERQGSAGKTIIGGILTCGGILIGMELILPAVLGTGRLKTEKYPVLPLLSEADLPGNVLARFDVLWMGFLLYSMLFAVGSLLHYGHLIMKKSRIGTGRFWLPILIYIVSIWEYNGYNIESVFEPYITHFYIPLLLILQFCLFNCGKNRLKKRVTAGVIMLLICVTIGGCARAVEPENRIYPFALGVDTADGKFTFSYGMPDLVKATGQEKGGEKNKSVLEISGFDFEEIEENYHRSQNKYMDLGHLEILVLGKSLIEENRWNDVLNYLKEQPFIGEDMWVFCADSAGEIVGWKGKDGTSSGEYLTGMMEKPSAGEHSLNKKTLRDVFYEKYKNGSLCTLPVVRKKGDNLELLQN